MEEPYYTDGTAQVEHRNIGESGSDHPLGDVPKEWKADLRTLLREVSDDLYDTWQATVREYLANAETACLKVEQYKDEPSNSPYSDMTVGGDYEPRITVEWRKHEQKLIIKDNGIGMAAMEVDEVFRHIGRSAARDMGTMSGAFGLGVLSFSKFIGNNNTMVMLSHSRLNDDNAAYLVTLAGIEPVRGSLDADDYGTKFSLDQKEQGMAIREAVRRFAEWMRVPVLYEEYDENGEEDFNDDYGDKRLYNNYEVGNYCNDFIVDGCFEAYVSEDATGETLLLSMEIERNASSQYDAPHPFDVRLLDESGKVVESSNGNEGLIPVARMEYEEMLLEARPEYITKDLLSNQDVVAYEAAGEPDYAIEQHVLDSDDPLPVADYVPLSEGDGELLGERVVILGPHEGRTVVSEGEWNELPEGRASQFVPEDELEPFDLQSKSGDLRLPKPTTDRSSLQSNETFWKYIARYFSEEYDEAVDEWRQRLEGADDPRAALQEMEPRTVADIKNNA